MFESKQMLTKISAMAAVLSLRTFLMNARELRFVGSNKL